MPAADGATKRDHLESAARQNGKVPAALHACECPPELAYLWRWFRDLSSGRGHTGFGQARLSWLDIAGWCLLTHARPESWEVRALMLLDAAWFKAVAAAQRQNNDQSGRGWP